MAEDDVNAAGIKIRIGEMYFVSLSSLLLGILVVLPKEDLSMFVGAEMCRVFSWRERVFRITARPAFFEPGSTVFPALY